MIELLSYITIGIAIVLSLGIVAFLAVIGIWERLDDWRIDRAARRALRRRVIAHFQARQAEGAFSEQEGA